MHCDKIIERLPAFQDGALTPPETQEVRSHLTSCPRCRDDMELLSRTWNALALLKPLTPSPDFRARFWERVREEDAARIPLADFPRLLWGLQFTLTTAVFLLGVFVSLNLASRMIPQDLTSAPPLTRWAQASSGHKLLQLSSQNLGLTRGG